MSETDGLVDWLLRQIAADEERVRRGSLGERTSWHGWHTVDCATNIGYAGDPNCTCRYVDRVLAECAAKRAIVALHDPTLRDELHRGDASAMGADLMHSDVLRLLAQPYRGAEGWRDEWAL